MKQLEGKIAVITGGTQGLGATVARLFAERGAEGIVTCATQAGRGERIAAEITKLARALRLRRRRPRRIEDCRRVMAAADRHFGRVDALVNVAAMTDRGTILDTTPELFDRMFAVNVRAPFFLMQDAIKLMRRDHVEGTIVNISSMSAMAGQPFITAYCSSKGALDTLTRNVAYSVLRNRIRVNGLNIGWMASDGEDRIQSAYHGAAEDWLAQAAAAQPFGRLVEPHEVARAVAYLSSAESGLMTGSTINFDQAIWGAYESAPQPAAPL